MIKVIPSVMAKNQLELDELLKKYQPITKEVHLDVVDEKFANNNSLDFNFKLSTKFKYHAHLMIRNPEHWIKKNGPKVDFYIVQASEINDKRRFISWMKKNKKKVAFALKPEEKVNTIKPYLKNIDYILILTVNPGFYGSKYLKKPLQKIKEIKKINPLIKVIIDGGMNPITAKEAVKAGADVIACGSYLAKADDVNKAMREMTKSLQ